MPDAESLPDPEAIDWSAVWATTGSDPDESIDGMGTVATALSISGEADVDQETAAEVVGAARDAGVLVANGGYRIAEYDDPDATTERTPDSTDVEDTESDDAGDHREQTGRSPRRERTTATGEDPAEMDRSELEAEVASLRNEVDKLQEVANRDVALLKAALRALVGSEQVDEVRDLPEAAGRFREGVLEQRDVVDDLAADMEVLDDLDGSGSQAGKVAQLRKYTVRKAEREDSRGSVDYKEAAGRLEVSEGYASTIISEAAEHRWFYTKKPGDRTQLRVKLEKVPPGHVFRSENTGGSE